MYTTRRQSLTRALAFSAAAVLSCVAWSQSYPSQAVRVIVPYPPGGTTDLIARTVSQALATMWGQPVVIENKPGAGTIIGAESVARSQPDGYTILATAEATFVVNPYVYRRLPYSTKDFIPVSGLGVSTHALVTHPSVPISNLRQLVSLARTTPGSLNYGTFGIGSSSHLNMELLQSAAGIRLMPVHYKGAAPMLTELIAGHIPLAFTGITLAAEPLRAGRLRALGIGGDMRLAEFPEMPTLAESGLPGFQAISWFGLFVPSNTPREVVVKINADVQRVLSNAEFLKKYFDPAYLRPLLGSPEQFAEYVKADDAKWSKIIKEAGVTLE